MAAAHRGTVPGPPDRIRVPRARALAEGQARPGRRRQNHPGLWVARAGPAPGSLSLRYNQVSGDPGNRGKTAETGAAAAGTVTVTVTS